MLHLDRDPAVVGDQGAQALGEADHVGDVRVHVVGHDQIRRPVLLADGGAGGRVQELGERGHPRLARRRADVHRRLDAEAADAPVHQVPQQVPVVARHLDHEGVRPERQPPDGVRDERAGVFHPGGRVRGEVRVLRERLLRRDQRRQLRQPAVGADPQVQRVRRFRPVQLVRREKALARRRRPEVDDARHRLRAAESASCHLLFPSPLPARVRPPRASADRPAIAVRYSRTRCSSPTAGLKPRS